MAVGLTTYYGGEKLNGRENLNLDRGVGETRESHLERLGEFLSRIRWQSEGHRQWYTHKNPYGCWICEILEISERFHAILLDDTDVDEPEYNLDEE